MDQLIKSLESYIQEVAPPYVTPKCSRGHIAVHTWTAAEAVAADTDGVHASITALATPQTITTEITNPPCARNITITCTKGGETDMSGNVVITGTNIFGQVITETIAEGADGTIQGNKAFKTVTSILVPVRTNEGDAITVGFGDKLGLSFYLNYKDQLIQCSLNDIIEPTRGTVTVDADEIEKNTLDLNSALDGHIVNAYIIIY